MVNKKLKAEEIEAIMQEPNFWDSAEKSQQYVKELKQLKDTIEGYHELKQQYEDIATLIEMGYEENDPSFVEEIGRELNKFVEALEELRLDTLLSGPYDKDNAILTLHAGAGGTESCDWASILCCPPAPLDRYVSIRRSSSLISISISSSISGITSQETNEVCRFPAALKGDIRTKRCTPCSDLR